MSPRRYKPNSTVVARAALARGPLLPIGSKLRFGRRTFNYQTINPLIESGEAARLTDGRVIGRSLKSWS